MPLIFFISFIYCSFQVKYFNNFNLLRSHIFVSTLLLSLPFPDLGLFFVPLPSSSCPTLFCLTSNPQQCWPSLLHMSSLGLNNHIMDLPSSFTTQPSSTLPVFLKIPQSFLPFLFPLVFEGLVKSNFLAQNGLTVTVTSPSKFQDPRKPDQTA